MRRSKILLGVAVAAIACASGVAHAHVGVVVGVGGPWYYPVVPGPYYYGPPGPVIVAPPPEPPDYIEQGQPESGQNDPSYAQGPGYAAADDQGDAGSTWYFCDASKTYYPYVKECASGWRAVPAQPAPQN
ncbi:hypothetical protein [Paraburkholderia adhaesiva]|uniref:hypothetical protein n=1 Tax=Paraburkholderia adhaesiva TaxID=2883244 RepID=UPI001F351D32|nr:hypothetical protein [Paraburkholderia adhaesiva]